MKRAALPMALLLAAAFDASAQFAHQIQQPQSGYVEPDQWQEVEKVQPPAYPEDAGLREIYISPVATNKYYVDADTLALGDDGVVRYVLVVKTSGGATNVSFEGMHCATMRWKHYATGRSDRTWTLSRAVRQEWRQIENKPVNPHHAVLSRNFFCPQGNTLVSTEDGRNALRLGKHPNAI